MSINYWRNVMYTDDGCEVYQCLMCYQTWESRTPPGGPYAHTPWKFCPYCGAKWRGEHECWHHAEKHYRYDRNPAYVKYPPIEWVLMSRTIWEEGDVDKWEIDHDMYRVRSAHEAYQYLQNERKRENEGIEWEETDYYRVEFKAAIKGR